jgi:hypothetical protein
MALPSAREPRAHVRNTGKKRSVYRAAMPADGTTLPITRGDLGTSRLRGGSGERYTSCGQCESGAHSSVAQECEIPWSAESIASSLLSGIGGQLANVAICRKMVSQ